MHKPLFVFIRRKKDNVSTFYVENAELSSTTIEEISSLHNRYRVDKIYHVISFSRSESYDQSAVDLATATESVILLESTEKSIKQLLKSMDLDFYDTNERVKSFYLWSYMLKSGCQVDSLKLYEMLEKYLEYIQSELNKAKELVSDIKEVIGVINALNNRL